MQTIVILPGKYTVCADIVNKEPPSIEWKFNVKLHYCNNLQIFLYTLQKRGDSLNKEIFETLTWKSTWNIKANTISESYSAVLKILNVSFLKLSFIYYFSVYFPLARPPLNWKHKSLGCRERRIRSQQRTLRTDRLF